MAGLHAVPHEPQFANEVSEASHPFAVEPSQLPKPELHDVSVHEPVEHDSVALARSHGTAQLPQSVSVRSEASHPFGALPSQLP